VTAEADTVTPVPHTRVARWLPGSIWVATAMLVVVAVVFALRDPTPYNLTLPDASAPILVVLIASLATVGALLALRRASNPVGWMLLASAPLLAGTLAASAYAHYSVTTGNDSPGTNWVAWVGAVVTTPGLALMGLVILVFPSGKLPRHGRSILAVLLSGIVLNTIAGALRPGVLQRDLPIVNPAGIEGLGDVLSLVETLGAGLLVIGMLLATASLLDRLRTASGDERRQLEWFAYVAVVLVAALALTVVPPLSDAAWAVALTAFAGLPVAIAIAILKYRLYDIEKLVNRTLVYLPLVGILGGLYAACVAFFQRLFVSFTGDRSDAAVVLTTLIVAGTFTPVRKNLEAAVDRAFKPGRVGTAPGLKDAVDARTLDLSPILDDPRLTLRIEEVARRVADDAMSAVSGIGRRGSGGSP
jgi:hypothetical protein